MPIVALTALRTRLHQAVRYPRLQSFPVARHHPPTQLEMETAPTVRQRLPAAALLKLPTVLVALQQLQVRSKVVAITTQLLQMSLSVALCPLMAFR